MSKPAAVDKIKFVGYYQTPMNAGTYDVTATLTEPKALRLEVETSVKLHVAGPRYFIPPSEVHSVFPPENGEGDYNNVLPHVVLNRCTLPWERLVASTGDDALEQIPFLALLVFTEDEEANGDVMPPITITVEDLGAPLEPGEKPTDKVNVIDVRRSVLEHIMPTGEELRLLTHGRERTQNGGPHKRAVVIANRLPARPLPSDNEAEQERRNIAHLVMLENRYEWDPAGKKWSFAFDPATGVDDPVRLVSLKSWQFTCTKDKPTLRGRLLGEAFSFDTLRVPEPSTPTGASEMLRSMSYAALPYHLRSGDRTHTLYHGPLVAALRNGGLGADVPASAEGLVRFLKDEGIFDVSLAAAWQLGRLLMLRDQSVAMEYFGWRRRHAQLRAKAATWVDSGHLHSGDDFRTGLTGMPVTVRNWCSERLRLRGLPFAYLVPDTRMLPENSLRVFRIHQGWMECLLSGALALGRAGDDDRILEAEFRSIVFPESAQGRTGFLLRSSAVDEHPDLEVAAVDSSDESLSEVRLERIGPGLLLGLYAGTIAKLEFSLPPIGLHFGLKELDGKDASAEQFRKDLRLETGTGTVSVKMRPPVDTDRGGPVVQIGVLAHDMGALTPDSFAFQMCEGTESVLFQVD